jgi:type I restriction enzyme S subunit
MSKKDFPKLQVRIPNLNEQQAIAKVLTAADSEIKSQENYLQQLQLQKKGLMQQLLTGKKRVKID